MSKPVDVLVAGGGGFIGGHLVSDLLQPGPHVRVVDVKPPSEWYQVHPDAENVVADLSLLEHAMAQTEGARRGLHARRRHGRHGLHREQQGALHAHGAHQHAHAAGRQAARGRALLLLLVGVRLRRRQADRHRRHRPQGGRRLPGDARGRLRLGEALHRADVPALPRGLRAHHPGRPLPQRLRPARHLDRRPREGARPRSAARSRPRRSPASTPSRSGATASRPAASCTSTTASSGTPDDPRRRQPGAGQPGQLGAGLDQRLWSTSSRGSPASAASASTSSTRPRACAAATATTPRSSRPTAGSPRSRSLDGLEQTYRWVFDQVKRSLG